MNYEIELCGPAKDYFENTLLTIQSEQPLSFEALKAQIQQSVDVNANQQKASELLSRCALSSETALIEKEGAVLESKLFLLPPVCGG